MPSQPPKSAIQAVKDRDTGELRFYDPEIQRYIRTHYEEAARAEAATARADQAEAELRRLRERLAALGDDPSGA